MNKESDFTCPNCGATSTQSVKVIHRDGYTTQGQLIKCSACRGDGIIGYEDFNDKTFRQSLGAKMCSACKGTGKVVSIENVPTAIGTLLSPPKQPSMPTKFQRKNRSPGCLFWSTLIFLLFWDISFVVTAVTVPDFQTLAVPLYSFLFPAGSIAVYSVLSFGFTFVLIFFTLAEIKKYNAKQKQNLNDTYEKEINSFNSDFPKWVVQKERWEKLWYCYRCNEIFPPTDRQKHVPVEQIRKLI